MNLGRTYSEPCEVRAISPNFFDATYNQYFVSSPDVQLGRGVMVGGDKGGNGAWESALSVTQQLYTVRGMQSALVSTAYATELGMPVSSARHSSSKGGSEEGDSSLSEKQKATRSIVRVKYTSDVSEDEHEDEDENENDHDSESENESDSGNEGEEDGHGVDKSIRMTRARGEVTDIENQLLFEQTFPSRDLPRVWWRRLQPLRFLSLTPWLWMTKYTYGDYKDVAVSLPTYVRMSGGVVPTVGFLSFFVPLAFLFLSRFFFFYLNPSRNVSSIS